MLSRDLHHLLDDDDDEGGGLSAEVSGGSKTPRPGVLVTQSHDLLMGSVDKGPTAEGFQHEEQISIHLFYIALKIMGGGRVVSWMSILLE